MTGLWALLWCTGMKAAHQVLHVDVNHFQQKLTFNEQKRFRWHWLSVMSRTFLHHWTATSRQAAPVLFCREKTMERKVLLEFKLNNPRSESPSHFIAVNPVHSDTITSAGCLSRPCVWSHLSSSPCPRWSSDLLGLLGLVVISNFLKISARRWRKSRDEWDAEQFYGSFGF